MVPAHLSQPHRSVCSSISLLTLDPVAMLLSWVPVPFIMPAAQKQLEKVSGIYHRWQELLSVIKKLFSPFSLLELFSFPSLIIIIIKKLNAICLAVS